MLFIIISAMNGARGRTLHAMLFPDLYFLKEESVATSSQTSVFVN